MLQRPVFGLYIIQLAKMVKIARIDENGLTTDENKGEIARNTWPENTTVMCRVM